METFKPLTTDTDPHLYDTMVLLLYKSILLNMRLLNKRGRDTNWTDEQIVRKHKDICNELHDREIPYTRSSLDDEYFELIWRSDKSLPIGFQKLPGLAKSVARATGNSMIRKGHSEATVAKAMWSAVKKVYRHDAKTDKWVKKQ